MVFVGGRGEEKRKDSKASEARFMMAMGPERSRILHNFSLPCLKWGGQRHLRCVKVHDDGGGGGGSRSPPTSSKPYRYSGGVPWNPAEPERKRRSFIETESFRRSSSRFQPATEIGWRTVIDSDVDYGIEAVRKKLMLDLQMEMDRMKFTVLSERSEEIEPPPARTEASVAAEARPWNLRTRRAVCKEPKADGVGGGKSQRVDDGNSSFSSARGSDGGGGDDNGGVKRPRAKFSVPLSKQEIEEDFIAIKGTRPPRRPRKRPRNVQKQLDTLVPGFWLSEITADMYKVNENPEVGKR